MVDCLPGHFLPIGVTMAMKYCRCLVICVSKIFNAALWEYSSGVVPGQLFSSSGLIKSQKLYKVGPD